MELKDDRPELRWSGPRCFMIAGVPEGGGEVTCTLTTGWLGRSWLLCERAPARIGDVWPVEFEPGPGVEIRPVSQRQVEEFILQHD